MRGVLKTHAKNGIADHQFLKGIAAVLDLGAMRLSTRASEPQSLSRPTHG
jgi:hypothetical protein